jgi:hypothetical protein
VAEAAPVEDTGLASPVAEGVDEDPAAVDAALADLLGLDWVSDADAAEGFWEEALARAELSANRAGLSLEEARRRGLLPVNWTPGA